MPNINYTSTQNQQVNDLRSYIEEYCQTNGIDPGIYTSALDGATIDPALLNDPAFQAYWQLAYLQLMEIINPLAVQSLYSEVGEIDFDALYSATDAETNEFIRNLVLDNPDLMAFAAIRDNDGATTADAVLQALQQRRAGRGTGPSSDGNSPEEYVDEEARDLADELGLGGVWDWMIDNEEGILSMEGFLMQGLAEIDQQLAGLQEALESGEMSAEAFEAQAAGVNMNRDLYLGLIQNLEDALGTIIEMFSQLIKAQNDQQLALARNMNVNA